MTRAEIRRRTVLTACLTVACASYAFALNPGLDISQYARTTWRVSGGFARGRIRMITQSADGYLWLATEFGVLRFDGVRTVDWQPPTGERLPSSDIRSLRWSRDGTFWIGTHSGLVSWDGRTLTRYPEFDGQVIEALLEDRNRTMWIVAGWTLSEALLCRIQSGRAECDGRDEGGDGHVTAVYEDHDGTLWAGAMTGVWRWQPGPPKFYPIAGPPQRTYALLESGDGGVLIARRDGVTKLRNGRFEPYALRSGTPFQPDRLLRDRDGGVWVGALVDRGLLHLHDGAADAFGRADGLSGGSVACLFEDREGNIWVATEGGLDRFREFAIPTLTTQQGLSSAGLSSILATRDGSVWIAASNGLNRWNNGHITTVSGRGLPDAEPQSLFADPSGNIWVATTRGVAILKSDRFHPLRDVPPGNAVAIAGDPDGQVWIAHDDALLHLVGERVVERFPWSGFGHKQPALALLHDSARHGFWIGFREGGVSFFADGQLRASYAPGHGLAGGIVESLYLDASDALWVAAEGGLSRIKGDRLLTLTTDGGLPCNTVHWMMNDDATSAWLYTACGLVRIDRSELDAWVSDPARRVRATVFDAWDGVSNETLISGYAPIAVKATDGRLWFLNGDGVGIVDPRRLVINPLPPPVHVEEITADGTRYRAGSGLRLPPRVRDVSIDYTALSLVAAEKVRFRYRLDGQDERWKEVVNDREVQYSNLPPGRYRFRVTASNNSGVWNESGATLDFSIAPAFYQTRWFAAMVVVLCTTLIWVAYRMRVAQLARQFNRTLEARVSERTRIARDLHDTLLQSLQGLLLQFQSASNLVRTRPDEASARLERALDQAEAALMEGRDAVQGLRASAVTLNDLANGIAAVGADLTSDPSVNPPVVAVEVDGASRDLNPVVREEAYRIATEALRNAVKHAQASRIAVTIHYEPRQLRLTVRDDGRGMDADAIRSHQREGHFGMPGMRERAAIVNGRLEVRSEPGAGTHIELRVPASIAYGKAARRWRWTGPSMVLLIAVLVVGGST